ncbi:MAG: LysM peptidoglycan-binding domain-containing protein, partial [Anaerolineales bacterium]
AFTSGPPTAAPVASATLAPPSDTLPPTQPPASDTPPPPPTALPVADTATPVPTGPIMLGEHLVVRGDTFSCIGRAYGVLPKAIADANGMALTDILFAGQILKIPDVQWTNIPAGPVCVVQFPSHYPPFVPQPGATLGPVSTAALPTNTPPPIPVTGTPTIAPPVPRTNTLPPIIILTRTPTRCFPQPCPPVLPTILPPVP